MLYWDVRQDAQIQNVIIYRSDRRYGYYEKIPLTLRKVLIEATQRYRYTIRDTSVVPGKTYFYYLESVYMDGRREVCSPILEFLAREKQ